MLLTAQGIGAVCSALVLAPLVMALGRRLLVGALMAFPLALVAYGLAPSLWGDAAAIVLVGACYIGVLTGLNTVVQRRAPPEARGRVLGLYMMVLGAIYPVGAVVEGAIAHVVGIRAVTAVSGVVLFTVMVGVGLFGGHLFAALGDADTSVDRAASLRWWTGEHRPRRGRDARARPGRGRPATGGGRARPARHRARGPGRVLSAVLGEPPGLRAGCGSPGGGPGPAQRHLAPLRARRARRRRRACPGGDRRRRA